MIGGSDDGGGVDDNDYVDDEQDDNRSFEYLLRSWSEKDVAAVVIIKIVSFVPNVTPIALE